MAPWHREEELVPVMVMGVPPDVGPEDGLTSRWWEQRHSKAAVTAPPRVGTTTSANQLFRPGCPVIVVPLSVTTAKGAPPMVTVALERLVPVTVMGVRPDVGPEDAGARRDGGSSHIGKRARDLVPLPW